MIPTINGAEIVLSIVAKYKDILAHNRKRKESEIVKENFAELVKKSETLFDIVVCKCSNTEDCKCKTKSRVPVCLKDFLDDQRNDRKLTVAHAIRSMRTAKDKDIESLNSQLSTSFISRSDCSYTQSSHSEPGPQNQMRYGLSNLVMAIDRTGVSLRNAAIIANAVLQDVGLIGPHNTSMR
ncbi:hypothetical protein PV328_006077 [Microctonus aethiopoides]|uniref:Uncharacterized protein n=1 Tax=Microctonus aethiopoides TaxID=144406 RepID=A0AA39FNJ1_9HYME|nr:hypothetical protein PV328_006077 [Microctonus aethiopoides]